MPQTNDEDSILLVDDPHWYKDAIIYELHVRAFMDSNGDGIGDFEGLVEKLDYLQDLGVTALWLLPFYPSPLRDDGYDIADYSTVNPSYGTLRDFKRFMKEAHRRGLRVITELVINHTSSEHPWFQRARRAPPGSKLRDYYVWSDTPERYQDARIIFQDFETSNWTWDPVAKAYYWHRFYSHQPDLNFENPDVHKALLKVLDFWLEMGIDGMRLDAVPYLFEAEGTNCENLPKTHAYLKQLRSYIDNKYKNRMLLAEANQWPEDAAAYFGAGDECHMNFHFPLMPRMFMSVQLENAFPVLDIMRQTPTIPENCQWALFLRNHDELTLEMVTDEDRDYMYRVYAADPQARINLGIRRRLAPLLKDRKKVELMKALLFALPGTPVLYYGDEIGQGDNIYLGDRNGVRTPMQWSGDRNAGFSKANPQKLYLPVIIDPEYHYEAINVEAQRDNTNSLLWWMKRLIALRKRYKVFGRGTIEFLEPENTKVLCFVRAYGDERILVVANLSRFPQCVELDLNAFEGMRPVELFGHTDFPPVTAKPYFLTLGPHNFYMFSLERPKTTSAQTGEPRFPTLEVSGTIAQLLQGRARASLETILPSYMLERRWFRGKAQKIKGATIIDTIPFGPNGDDELAHICFVQVEYVEEGSEVYVLPLAYRTGKPARKIEDEHPNAVIARITLKAGGKGAAEEGLLVDAVVTEGFEKAILDGFDRRKILAGPESQLQPYVDKALREKRGNISEVRTHVAGVEQSNTSITYGDRLILKLFRRLEPGINPELEMGRFLCDRAGYCNVPALLGALEYRNGPAESGTMAVLQSFVPNQGDAWTFTLDSLDRYFERTLAQHRSEQPVGSAEPLLARAEKEIPPGPPNVIGTYLPLVRLLGQRTAELHVALANATEDAAFTPEPFSLLYQRSLYQSARTRLTQSFQLLRRRLRTLPEDARETARALLDRQSDVDQRLKLITGEKISALRTRCHGDFHLGQVLFTGKDFVIIDFEGEPARPIGERRFKWSPLRDVAAMLRSFHYASVWALRHGHGRREDIPALEPWAESWRTWISTAYLSSYLDIARTSTFLPKHREELEMLLDFYLVDKCVYELGYELNNRPDWVTIPTYGLCELLRIGAT